MAKRKKVAVGYWIGGILAAAILMNILKPTMKSGVVAGDEDSQGQGQSTPTPTATPIPGPTIIPTSSIDPTPTTEIVIVTPTGEPTPTPTPAPDTVYQAEPTPGGLIQNVIQTFTGQQSSGGTTRVTPGESSAPTASQLGGQARRTTTVRRQASAPEEPSFKAELVKTQLDLTSEKIGDLKKVGLTVPGLSNTINMIITEHNDFSQRVDVEVVKINKRGKLVKWILGPNFTALRELNQLLATNVKEIKTLQDLLFKVSDQNDIDSIKAAVEAIQQENAAIQDQIDTEGNMPSVFGFVMKIIAK